MDDEEWRAESVNWHSKGDKLNEKASEKTHTLSRKTSRIGGEDP